jgi:hypothetical protein
MHVLTLQRVTLDLARDLLLTMHVLTIQRVTLDLLTLQRVTLDLLTLQRVTLDLLTLQRARARSRVTRCNVKTCIVNKR